MSRQEVLTWADIPLGRQSGVKLLAINPSNFNHGVSSLEMGSTQEVPCSGGVFRSYSGRNPFLLPM